MKGESGATIVKRVRDVSYGKGEPSRSICAAVLRIREGAKDIGRWKKSGAKGV
jgi:hypothetical protein